jgi:site-specific recombinase XerD
MALGHKCSVRRCKHPRYKWVVSYRSNGDLKHKYCKTKRTAEQWADDREGANAQFGTGAELTADDRLCVLEKREELKEFGWTVRMAMDHALKHLESVSLSATAEDWQRQFIREKSRKRLSEVTVRDYESRLRPFVETFRGRYLTTITSEEVADYLHTLNQSPISINNVRRIIYNFFQRAIARKLCGRNPVAGVDPVKQTQAEIGILTPPEAKKLLESADPAILPRIALGLFAGIRSAELERLSWESINVKRGVIRIPASAAKTNQQRQIPIVDNLATWLKPHAEKKGPVSPRNADEWMKAAIDGAGLRPWKSNCIRHSFGSYRLEQCQNAGQVALEMGNGPAVVLKHYRELVFPEDAKQYWGIAPKGNLGRNRMQGR